MMCRNNMLRKGCGVGLTLVCASALVSGCNKQEEAPQVDAAPRTSAPAAPRWSLDDLDMDPRVQFPDRAKPSSEALAQAVADFASALMSGDEAAFGEMLSSDGQAVLSVLKESGDWGPATEGLRAVRICRIDEGAEPVLALGIEDDVDATLLAWTMTPVGGGYTFTPMPIDPPHAERVAMLDDAPLEPPTFGAASAAEAPLVVNAPEDPDDKKKERRERNAPPPGPSPTGPR